MMKTVILPLALAVAAAVALAAGATYWWLQGDDSPWTTKSPQAREQLELGLAAENKFYLADALEHYERALELDPDFAIAKLFRNRGVERRDPRYAQVIDALRQVDLESLSPRERMLIQRQLALEAGERDKARILVDGFLERYPTDPFALDFVCSRAWIREDWATAESCYQELRELHPDRVLAQNLLGYMTMAQGRFAEAEEHLRTYLYIAPDQANPHDSLGELLTVVGRYPEAEAAFREALRIKPDFCDAYPHLLLLHVYAGRLAEAEATLREFERVEECQPIAQQSQCGHEFLLAYLGGDRAGAWQLATSERCHGRLKGSAGTLLHRAAVLDGHADVAAKIEASLLEEEKEAQRRGVGKRELDTLAAVIHHTRGVAALVAGDTTTAAQLFERADEQLTYRDAPVGTFKLYNRLHRVESLRRLGRLTEAAALEQEIDAVNPHFRRVIHLDDLPPATTAPS